MTEIFIDCDICGHEWKCELIHGPHSEFCPGCESELVMNGEDVLYQVKVKRRNYEAVRDSLNEMFGRKTCL